MFKIVPMRLCLVEIQSASSVFIDLDIDNGYILRDPNEGPPLTRKIFNLDLQVAEKPLKLQMFVCLEQLDEGFAPPHHQRGTVCLASSGRLVSCPIG